VHERSGELHALLVAERQLLDRLRGPLRDAEPLDPARGRRAGLGLVAAVQRGEVAQLAVHVHLRESPRSSGM
jgi:hypothetical protein